MQQKNNFQISTDVLLAWGAVAKKYKKNEVIFYEDDLATFFYQIIEGSVKMINLSNDGKEFIQGIFKDGQSFGEPVLFIDKPYPATAVAIVNTIVLKLNKDSFLKLIEQDMEAMKIVLKILAKRVYSKSITTRELMHHSAEEKIVAYLKDYKKSKGMLTSPPILINHTRQEIANLTGLRVETVIRSIKKLEQQGKLKIVNRKLFF